MALFFRARETARKRGASGVARPPARRLVAAPPLRAVSPDPMGVQALPPLPVAAAPPSYPADQEGAGGALEGVQSTPSGPWRALGCCAGGRGKGATAQL